MYSVRCVIALSVLQPCQVASLIQLYCRIDNRVAKLCVAMKYWAKVGEQSTIHISKSI